MKREILFRGKRVDNGEWVYGYYLYDPETTLMSCVIYSERKFIKVIPETVGQFTGLMDKNGTKIFEGDLLSVHDHYMDQWSKDSAPVVFSHDYVGGWVISNGKENLTLGKRQDKIQITSNIHDNPTT